MTLPGTGLNEAIEESSRCRDCQGWGWRWEVPYIGAVPSWRDCKACRRTGRATRQGDELSEPARSPDTAKYLLKCLARLAAASAQELSDGRLEKAARDAGASDGEVQHAREGNPNR